MTRTATSIVAVATILLSLGTRVADAGPQPLFDGKSFDGWEIRGGKATYEIEDGAVVGVSAPNTENTFLCSKARYGDFILTYEFKCDNALNSGVMIRAQAKDENTTARRDGKQRTIPAGRVHGYQVEIDPNAPKRLWTSGIYDEARRGWLFPGPKGGDPAAFTAQGKRLFKFNQWNSVRVECRGNRIRTWLNGEPRADFTDDVDAEGFIGLQVHGVGDRRDPLRVRWRNLMIEKLDANSNGSDHQSETAIRQAIASYVDAFNRHDAEAVAAHWTEDGELVTPGGVVLRGRNSLSEDFGAYFAESGNVRIELFETSIQLLSPGVAVETGVARVIVPGHAPNETEYEAVHVKTPVGWKMDSVREQAPPEPPPSNYDKLSQLEWMVGKWVNADDQSSTETSCRWTTNKNFLVRTFNVFVEDRVDFEGTQVIGWDPHVQTIRSWLFDSDGGFGVGRWSGGENQWTVQSLHVLPDGRRATSTNVYDIVDQNTVQFRTVGRQVDGELLPNVDPVTIRREN